MSTTERQIKQREILARAAGFAVDGALLEAPQLTQVPRANQTRFIVHCALAYLLSQDLITCAPNEKFEQWLPVDIPEEVRPQLKDFVPAWMLV